MNRKKHAGVAVLLSTGLLAAIVFIPQAQRMGGPRQGMPMNPVMAALDQNQDGALSADEIAKATASLKSLDKDGDGAISREEARPAFNRGGGPGRPDRPGRQGPPPGAQDSAVPFTSKFVPKDDAEKKAISVMQELMADERFRNVPEQDGRLLRLLTEAMQAKHVVEMGTSTGYSGLWFGMGLKKTGGKMTTYEIDEGRANTARKNFKAAGFADIITVVLGDAHEEVKDFKGTIDILFLDADKEGYIDYLDKLMPKIRPGGLIIAHNINARMADANFIEAISNKPDLETHYLQGMSFTLKKH